MTEREREREREKEREREREGETKREREIVGEREREKDREREQLFRPYVAHARRYLKTNFARLSTFISLLSRLALSFTYTHVNLL
jgi:hypothetical protein